MLKPFQSQPSTRMGDAEILLAHARRIALQCVAERAWARKPRGGREKGGSRSRADAGCVARLLNGDELEGGERHDEAPQDRVEHPLRRVREAQVVVLLVLRPLLDRRVAEATHATGNGVQTGSVETRRLERAVPGAPRAHSRAPRPATILFAPPRPIGLDDLQAHRDYQVVVTHGRNRPTSAEEKTSRTVTLVVS